MVTSASSHMALLALQHIIIPPLGYIKPVLEIQFFFLSFPLSPPPLLYICAKRHVLGTPPLHRSFWVTFLTVCCPAGYRQGTYVIARFVFVSIFWVTVGGGLAEMVRSKNQRRGRL